MSPVKYPSDYGHEGITQVVDASVKAFGIQRDVNEGTADVYTIEFLSVDQTAPVRGVDVFPPVMRHARHDSDRVTHGCKMRGQVSHQWTGPGEIRMKPHVQDQYPHKMQKL